MLQGSKLRKLGGRALAAQRPNNCICKMEKLIVCVRVIFRQRIRVNVDVFRRTVKRTLDDHYSTYFSPELMAK